MWLPRCEALTALQNNFPHHRPHFNAVYDYWLKKRQRVRQLVGFVARGRSLTPVHRHILTPEYGNDILLLYPIETFVWDWLTHAATRNFYSCYKIRYVRYGNVLGRIYGSSYICILVSIFHNCMCEPVNRLVRFCVVLLNFRWCPSGALPARCHAPGLALRWGPYLVYVHEGQR